MGLFDKLFGRGKEAATDVEAPAEPEPAAVPLLVALCRHGMNVPSAEEIENVLAIAYPEGLPSAVARVGLSQPSWFKTQEIARSAASDVAQAMAQKLGLEDYRHEYRIIEREGAAKMLVVGIFGA